MAKKSKRTKKEEKIKKSELVRGLFPEERKILDYAMGGGWIGKGAFTKFDLLAHVALKNSTEGIVFSGELGKVLTLIVFQHTHDASDGAFYSQCWPDLCPADPDEGSDDGEYFSPVDTRRTNLRSIRPEWIVGAIIMDEDRNVLLHPVVYLPSQKAFYPLEHMVNRWDFNDLLQKRIHV